MLSLEYGYRVALINPDKKEDQEDITFLRLITFLLGGGLEDEPLTNSIKRVSDDDDDLVVDASEE